MNSNDEIIKIINDRRKEKGYSLTQLAQKTGVAKSSLSRYFNKSREFPVNKAETFGKVLGLSAEEILGISRSSPTNAELDKALDEARSFDGVPVNDHDRAILKGMIKAYFDQKGND